VHRRIRRLGGGLLVLFLLLFGAVNYVQVFAAIFPEAPLDELEHEVAEGQRKFDEANRDRDEAQFLVTSKP